MSHGSYSPGNVPLPYHASHILPVTARAVTVTMFARFIIVLTMIASRDRLQIFPQPTAPIIRRLRVLMSCGLSHIVTTCGMPYLCWRIKKRNTRSNWRWPSPFTARTDCAQCKQHVLPPRVRLLGDAFVLSRFALLSA